MVPEYLCEVVSIKRSPRKLRSSSQILLQVPVSRLKSYGNCACIVAAATLWNRLPADMRNFKSLLKTHLFKVAFPDKKRIISYISYRVFQTNYLGYYNITYCFYRYNILLRGHVGSLSI